jgi:hypothetical protein
MRWVRFEATISASEKVKTVHALDRAATVTGYWPPKGLTTRTSNHSAVATSHILQFFSVFCVFTRRCLVTGSNGGHSSFSGFPNCPRSQLRASKSLSSPLTHSLHNQLAQLNSPTRDLQIPTLFLWLQAGRCQATAPIFRRIYQVVA